MQKSQPIFTHVSGWSTLPHGSEEARLKAGLVPTHKGPTRTMSELKIAAKLVYTSNPQLQCISTEIPVENDSTPFVPDFVLHH